MVYTNNKPFTTKDRDNDNDSTGNCAVRHKSGWWHSRCTSANLNGQYYGSKQRNPEAIYWRGLSPNFESLKRVDMKIKLK